MPSLAVQPGQVAPRLSRSRLWSRLALLMVTSVVLLAASLVIGSFSVRLANLFGDGPEAQLARDVVFGLRLPRGLAALSVGGLLGMAGALMQILLRNPLADPYVLGVSGGASVGAMLLLLLLGPSAFTPLGASAGAVLAIFAVFALGRSDGSATQARLLLTGVAVAAFSGALTSLLLSLASDSILRGMVFWLLGDLSGANWWPSACALLVLVAATIPFLRDLNIFALGPARAQSLGVNAARVRNAVFFIAAIATAIAVTTAGMIGFVGLLVPHALRLIFGNDQRLLVPASAIGGGMLLLAADLIARTLIAPQQLQVGIVTAALGAPFFLYLLNRKAQ